MQLSDRSKNWAGGWCCLSGKSAGPRLTRQKSNELGSLLHYFTGGLFTAKPADGFLKFFSIFFLVEENVTTVYEKCYITLVFVDSWENILEIKCSN